MADRFTTGFLDECGIEAVEYGQGKCVLACRVEARHLNPAGIVHGGLLFTMMDSAAGIAAKCSGDLPRGLVTRCADVHYLRPAVSGTLTAKGEVIKNGRHTAYAVADVFGGDGVLLCHGEFELCYIDNM